MAKVSWKEAGTENRGMFVLLRDGRLKIFRGGTCTLTSGALASAETVWEYVKTELEDNPGRIYRFMGDNRAFVFTGTLVLLGLSGWVVGWEGLRGYILGFVGNAEEV